MAETYSLLKRYAPSIYVRSWVDKFPDCCVLNVNPVYTNASDLQIQAIGPIPEGFKYEFQVTSMNSKFKVETTTVPLSDLRLPVLPDYSSHAVDKKTKEHHNNLVAEHATGEWVVLDDAKGNTTKALRKKGVADITIPNPSLTHMKGATVYPGLLVTYILTCERRKSFYLDYTCSWVGSKTGIKPIVDVNIILTRQILAEDGILAITVCMRHLKRKKRATHLDDIQADIASMSGYVFERVYGCFYRNNFMAFLMLKSVSTTKRRRIQREFFMHETHGGLMRKV
jgi:hypothetical protein